ncbi:MAG TPA: methylaspartate mutase accessory protein GlmL [Halanaerobiales bacterium]|nr:methylaspartate mutase accessory protein GlmL [Halanaerobiales bacterium]
METALLIDIGSTFTKVSLIDTGNEEIIAHSRANTTVKTDVNTGLRKALAEAKGWEKARYKLACSSAAGGLKIIAIGLVPEMTAEAARRAALGAGSRVLKTYSYQLADSDIEDIKGQDADIILLAGGTDGGNRDCIIHNARKLAAAELNRPVVVAGNRSAVDEVSAILKEGGKEIYLTENVMPELEKLNIEPARRVIREIFLKRIIKARGLTRVREMIDDLIMPTPAAVMKAAKLLADGTANEAGLGELMLVDIGGATTDVHSAASGEPGRTGVTWRGLEEPYIKRTVEGDLGMRYSALSLYQAIGPDRFCKQLEKAGAGEITQNDYEKIIGHFHKRVDSLARGKEELIVDKLLGRNAVRLAVARHAGVLKTINTPMGPAYIQEGKDLSQLKRIIGTGGIIVNNDHPRFILEGALYKNQENPELLAPVEAEFMVDSAYIMAACGLLSEIEPETSLRIMKRYLVKK